MEKMLGLGAVLAILTWFNWAADGAEAPAAPAEAAGTPAIAAPDPGTPEAMEDWKDKLAAGIPAADAAVTAARELKFEIPVMCREWHVWWASPYGQEPEAPTWMHWKDYHRFDQFDPTRTINQTVPGLAWRRWLNCVGYPLLGPYGSGERDIIRWQLETARNAGIECLHIHLWPSLWDEGRDFTPLPIFEKALEVAASLNYPIGVHDEIMFRRPNITQAQQLKQSIRRAAGLIKRYGQHPGWYKIDGQPVYYFQNWSGWIKADDLAKFYAEVEAETGPVHWMLEMAPREEFVKIPQVKSFLASNNSWFLHTAPFGVGPHPWAELEKQLQQARELTKRLGKRLGILIYTRFNNNNDRSQPGKGRISAEDGQFYVKSLALAKKIGPEFLVLTQWNDFEECAFIEPAWDCDGFNGDPYRYCRITAAARGRDFTPAPLPERASLDPYIRHHLFGDTQPGDLGPVFQDLRLDGRKLSLTWAEGAGEPQRLAATQAGLAAWRPEDPAGELRLGNFSSALAPGRVEPERGALLSGKDELRFFLPARRGEPPADCWLAVRADLPEGTNLVFDYHCPHENYRLDSLWRSRQVSARGSAQIAQADGSKVYWLLLTSAYFTGYEGDLTVKLNGKKEKCAVREVLLWSPRAPAEALAASAATTSFELPAKIAPEQPYVLAAYDSAGNPGLPRLVYAGQSF